MWTRFSATVPYCGKYHTTSEKSPDPSLGGRKGRILWILWTLSTAGKQDFFVKDSLSSLHNPNQYLHTQCSLSWLQAWGMKDGGWNLFFLLLTSLSLACVLAFLASSRGWATKCRLCNCSNSAYELNAPMFTFPTALAQCKDELWDAC